MKKILLIEPDQKTARFIKKTLESKDIEVFAVFSAQEAIHAADEAKFDLVILELAIPDQNGVAFLHEFRSYEDWSNVSVIIHTHLLISDQTTEKAWQILKINKFLYKPTTTLKKLKSTVDQVLNS